MSDNDFYGFESPYDNEFEQTPTNDFSTLEEGGYVGDVNVRPTGVLGGTMYDSVSGRRFRKNEVASVDRDTAERLLGWKHRGKNVFEEANN